jgi:hypothetical protein
MQTIGILIAALWGIYAFIYKEVMAPQSAPTEVVLDLSLTKLITDKASHAVQTHGLIPVEIRVSAKNPSSRTLYLLPNIWTVYGYKVQPSKRPRATPERDSPSAAVSLTNLVTQTEFHCLRGPRSLVAYGGLLSDDSLKPGEVSSRTFIVYIPQNRYDLLRLEATMHTVTKPGSVQMEWRLSHDSMKNTMYRLGPGGKRTQVERDKDGKFADHELMEEVELQRVEPATELSLWE